MNHYCDGVTVIETVSIITGRSSPTVRWFSRVMAPSGMCPLRLPLLLMSRNSSEYSCTHMHRAKEINNNGKNKQNKITKQHLQTTQSVCFGPLMVIM